MGAELGFDPTVVFIEIAHMANRLGASPLSRYEDCWEYQVSDGWWIAVNGHAEPRRCSHNNIEVPPFTAYIEWNGWPAGFIDPRGGDMAAGELANEDTLVAALKAVTAPQTGGAAGP
jgi:hypothetical protein